MSRKFLLVGLTGGIASGKSSVSEVFRQLGCVIIDADVLAREVVEPGAPAYGEIAAEFGRGVLRPDGTLDRKKLGAVVFADPDTRRRLEAITHPRIRERFAKHLAALVNRDFDGIAIFDAPVMIESGNYKNLDRLVVVVTDAVTQRARAVGRDGDAADVERRIASQMPLAEKAKLADYVIDNSGTREATAAEVCRVSAALRRELGAARRAAKRVVPLAALFPVGMGIYKQNRVEVQEVFKRLVRQSSGSWFIGWHSRPSGNFLLQDPGRDVLAQVLEVGERVTNLRCIARQFPDLVRFEWATPETARTVRGSVVVGSGARAKRVIAVMLSQDVPSEARVVGRLRRGIEAIAWPSAQDVLCLYDRPRKGGSVGHVTDAVLAAARRLGATESIRGTGRGMRVLGDLMDGTVCTDPR